MKRLRKVTLTIVLSMGLSIGALAGADDGWGNSGATPGPVKDTVRSNHWWWPTTPPSNATSSDAWGNRGQVCGKFTPPPPPPAPAPRRVTPPPAAPAPVAQRTVPVFNSVLFGFDSSTLSDSGGSEISKIAGMLKENSGDSVVIEGHTDNTNRSGDPDYNVKLGQRRADSVREALVSAGVASSRVKAVSMGDNSPAVSNDSSDNRALNRRVVFVYNIDN